MDLSFDASPLYLTRATKVIPNATHVVIWE